MRIFYNWLILLLLAGFMVACNKDYIKPNVALDEQKAAPSITGLSTPSGYIGDTLVIRGSFPEGGEVIFGTRKLDVIAATDKEITVVVPYGTGSAFVMVNAGVLRSNKVTFTYNLPAPKQGIQIGDDYYSIDTTTLMQVGPGTEYMVLSLLDRYGSNHLKVHLTFVDANHPNLSFRAVLARDTVLNVETVPAMAVRKSTGGLNYFAGVNGDLFNNTTGNANFGRVNNSSIVNGLITNMNYQVPAYAPVYFNGNKIYFDDFQFFSFVQLPDGEKVGIKNVNNARGQDDLILFNNARGLRTYTNNFGTEMAVMPIGGTWGDYTSVRVRVNSKVVRDQPGNTAIPVGGAVVSAHDLTAIPLNRYGVGDTLTISNYAKNTATGDIVQQMVSGDVRILTDGNITAPATTKTARTVIGASADKSKIVFCAAEGIIEGVSVGVSATEIAQLLKLYGIDNAVNMNGGAFSTMYIKGAGFNNGGLVNRPNNTTTAPNAGNALYAVSNAPTDAIVVKLVTDMYTVRTKANESITPKFYGLNKYGHIAMSNIATVTLTGGEDLGVINGTTFTAGAIPGITQLNALYNGLQTNIKVIIE